LAIRDYFDAAGSEGRSGDLLGQASLFEVRLGAMSPRDREVLEGSGDLIASGEFRDRTWQRVARVEGVPRGEKKLSGSRSAKPNGPGGDFGIVSKK
jgi:hypothetical protein